MRRCAVLVTFFGGMLAYREQNFRPKFACIVALLIGVFLLNWKP